MEEAIWTHSHTFQQWYRTGMKRTLVTLVPWTEHGLVGQIAPQEYRTQLIKNLAHTVSSQIM